MLADEQGEIARDGLAQSEAMQCFDLTADECETVLSHLIPRSHKATVKAKDLLRRLGSCMDYADQAVKASDGARIEPAGADDVSTARPTPSWTAFKASNTLVAAGNSAGCIAIVRIDGGNEVCRFHETMQPQNGNDIPPLRRSPVTAVTWASLSTVISGSQDGVMRIWDVATGNCSWYCSGHTGPLSFVTASCPPLVASLASGLDYVPRVWNIKMLDPYAADRAQQMFEGHDGNVLCLGFVQGDGQGDGQGGDGTLLATGGVDATVRIWRCDDGVCLMNFRPGHQAITCLASCGMILVTGSKDACVQVWDVSNMRHHGTFAGHHMAVTSVDITDDRIVTSSEDGSTMVWSARLRKLRFSMDNQGLINRKPDAPKNVPEQVVLQTVGGDNLVTKTQLGYPTLRTFNSSSQQVARKTGPCGFMSGHGNSLDGAPDQAHKQIAPPPTPQTALASLVGEGGDRRDRGRGSSVESVVSAPLSELFPGSSWLHQNTLGLSSPTSPDGEGYGMLIFEDGCSPVLQGHNSARVSRRRGERRDREGLGQWLLARGDLPAHGDVKDDEYFAFPPSVDSNIRGAWGIRAGASGATTASPTRALDSRYRQADIGRHLETASFHLETPSLRAGSQKRPNTSQKRPNKCQKRPRASWDGLLPS